MNVGIGEISVYVHWMCGESRKVGGGGVQLISTRCVGGPLQDIRRVGFPLGTYLQVTGKNEARMNDEEA